LAGFAPFYLQGTYLQGRDLGGTYLGGRKGALGIFTNFAN
jgi:hypothetical protein